MFVFLNIYVKNMTSGQRKIKKAIIVLIVFSFLVIVHHILFPKTMEPCFNGILDLGEDKIDCGGICVKECPAPLIPPEVNQIEVKWVKFVEDNGKYDLVAKIFNNNSSWGLSLLDYRFVIFGKNGEMLKTEKKETYIMPKGLLDNDISKYVIESNFAVDFDISRIEIEMSNYNWEEIKDSRDLSDFSSMTISVINEKGEYLEDESGFYYVYGETKNNSQYVFGRVDIYIVIFDKNDNIIAVGETDQWTVSDGGVREFRKFWNNPFQGEIDHIDYNAQTNVFDLANFMKDFGTGEKYIIPR